MLYFAGGYPGLYVAPPALVEYRPPAELPTLLIVEIPMRMVTGGVTPVVTIHTRPTIAMALIPRSTVPMTRGMAEHAEIPMRVQTSLTLER